VTSCKSSAIIEALYSDDISRNDEGDLRSVILAEFEIGELGFCAFVAKLGGRASFEYVWKMEGVIYSVLAG
jgi:hypothetical protein